MRTPSTKQLLTFLNWSISVLQMLVRVNAGGVTWLCWRALTEEEYHCTLSATRVCTTLLDTLFIA